ncbi:MAG: hypothetical protein P8I61_02610 [Opitutae bacterium]|jgi:hypothetical protein|nr:hypothetical protein [Opitutae bacterium]
MASKTEQMADTNMVNIRARKNNVIILDVGWQLIQHLEYSKKSAF